MVFSPSGTKWKEVGGSGREWKKVGANGARQKSTGTTLGGFAQLERPWVPTLDLRLCIHITTRIPVPPAALPRTILVTYYVLENSLAGWVLAEPALVERAFHETTQPIPLGPLDVGSVV